ncbi:MAG: SGNH/GDSL hydrolase family protein [Polyangiaceae bacterium]
MGLSRCLVVVVSGIFATGCSDGDNSIDPTADGKPDVGAVLDSGSTVDAVADRSVSGDSGNSSDVVDARADDVGTTGVPDGSSMADRRGADDANRDVPADIATRVDVNSDGRDAMGDRAATADVRDATSSADVGPPTDSGASDAALAPITVWIAGDSTVQTYAAGNTSGVNGAELEGWGQEIGQFFNNKVTISNQAIGGRSVAFFMWSVAKDASGAYLCVDSNGTPQFELDAQGNRIDTAQWSRIKNGIKPGDYVLAQFGTNDQAKACPKYVNLADFATYFGMLGDAVRAKGGIPIFVTPMAHRSFTGTTPNNGLLGYSNAMKDEATLKSVPIADLNLRSVEYYAMVGDAYLAANIFDTGSTHFVKAGAAKMASLVVGELRAKGSGLAAYLK